jgi:peptidoglycan/LPS O-acetylase OafA/YrhL
MRIASGCAVPRPCSVVHMTTVQPVALAHTSHRPQLDALRCFAVCGVLIAHFYQPVLSALAAAVDPGFLGVRLFFVLSGFLITGILLDARDAADATGGARVGVLGRFYARRVLRIFPLYYAIVLGGLLVAMPRAREAWPWLLGYASNFYGLLTQRSVGYYGHFWTLAVEEQFYIVWPWLVLFAPRRWIAPIMVSAILSAVVYRELVGDLLFTQRGWDQMPVNCLDTLGVGALLALVFRDGPSPERLQRILRNFVLPIGLVSFLLLNWHASQTGNARLLVAGHELAFAFICCWLIAGAYRGFRGPAARLLEARPLVYLGRISYGIYAYHLLVPVSLAKAFGAFGWSLPPHGLARLAIAGAVTIAIAAVSWHFFEAPINALKRRVPYERQSSTRVLREPLATDRSA